MTYNQQKKQTHTNTQTGMATGETGLAELHGGPDKMMAYCFVFLLFLDFPFPT